MKSLFLLTLFLLIASLLSEETPSFEKIDKPKQCGRKLVFTENAKSIKLRAVSLCKPSDAESTDPKQRKRRAAALTFAYSVNKLPSVRVSAFAKTEEKAARFDTVFAMVSVIEYKEGNGVPGYQPNTTDVVVQRVTLNSNNWKNFRKNLTTIGEDKVVSYSSDLDSSSLFKKFGISVHYSSTEVKDKNGAPKNVSRPVLRPSASKFSIDIKDITYQNTDSTGIGIECVLTSRGAAKKRSTSEQPSDLKAPAGSTYLDEASETNHVLDIEGDSSTEREGFFSYQAKADADGTTVDIYRSDIVIPKQKPDSDLEDVDTKHKHRVFYFSVASRAEKLFIDPALGTNEADESFNPTDSGASSCVISLGIVVLSILVSFFAM